MSLTQQDLQAIKIVVKTEVNTEVKPLKKGLESLQKYVAGLPTKNEVKSIVQAEIEPLQKYVAGLPTRHEFNEFKLVINEKISNLPTKDEFFTAMDQYTGEQKDIREELSAQQLQIDRLNVKVGLA